MIVARSSGPDLGKQADRRFGLDLADVLRRGFSRSASVIARLSSSGIRVRVEKDQLFDTLDALDRCFGVLQQLFSGDEEHLCSGIFKNIPDLLNGLRRVDRHVHSPKAEDREVGQRPFGTVLGNDRDPVARP